MIDEVVDRGLGVDHVGHGGEALLVPHGGDHADARHAGHLHSLVLLLLLLDSSDSQSEESFEFH